MPGTSETTRSHRVNFPIAFKSASGFYIFFSAYVNGSLMTAAPYEGDAVGNADKSTTHTTCTCQCVSSAKWGLNIEWFAFED